MGVARPHRRPPVLEDLDVVDEVEPAQGARLFGPYLDHATDILERHVRQGQVMARRERDDPADAALALCPQQAAPVKLRLGRGRQEGREIVVEDESARIGRVPLAPGAFVARAKITGGVIGRPGLRLLLLHLAQPGALRPMRRDQNPLAGERVEAAVRFGKEIHRLPESSVLT